MAAIPRKLYAFIEKKLFEAPYAAVSEAAEALIERREEALCVKSPGSEGGGGKTNAVSNRVQDGVLRVIAAEENLHTASKWAYVLARLDEIFGGTDVAEVAKLYYGEKLPEAEIARSKGISRQTIRNRRDEYVTRAALLAAENGLVRLSEYDERRAGG